MKRAFVSVPFSCLSAARFSDVFSPALPVSDEARSVSCVPFSFVCCAAFPVSAFCAFDITGCFASSFTGSAALPFSVFSGSAALSLSAFRELFNLMPRSRSGQRFSLPVRCHLKERIGYRKLTAATPSILSASFSPEALYRMGTKSTASTVSIRSASKTSRTIPITAKICKITCHILLYPFG